MRCDPLIPAWDIPLVKLDYNMVTLWQFNSLLFKPRPICGSVIRLWLQWWFPVEQSWLRRRRPRSAPRILARYLSQTSGVLGRLGLGLGWKFRGNSKESMGFKQPTMWFLRRCLFYRTIFWRLRAGRKLKATIFAGARCQLRYPAVVWVKLSEPCSSHVAIER